MDNLHGFVLLAPITGALGAWMGSNRKMGAGTGFIIGLFFSFLGLLVVGFFPVKERTKKCPECDEEIKFNARKCRYCRAVLDEDEDEE